ncbi:hypothetical protein BIW53_02135 [Pseudoalteromonas byunsanensis]|uniref:Uncharacterized protein n=1 Tax=Pseudoalteromonas byunsanensis TaxID=327939 RepID=A0A1S1NCL6_9GAMM|nr:hypothetical protein BIW53_02135 [Pseudoalteromonas byunsanensis]
MIRSHLKIFKPERLGSAPNAGGHRTNNAVVSGKLNDVFSSISDVDHARSAFDLVKLYPAVSTNDASKLQDAHVFISDQPEDPLVSTLLVESPLLRDDSLLPDMLGMMTDSNTKFHGTTYLTATTTSDSLELQVDQTTRSLAPTVQRRTSKVGMKPPISQMFRSVTITSYGELREFNVDIPDLLSEYPNITTEYQTSWGTIKYLANGPYINGSNVSGELHVSYPLRSGHTLFVYYLSKNDFRFHSFIDGQITLQAGETIVPNHTRLKKQGSNSVYTDDGLGRFIANGYVFARIDYETGVITEIGPVDYNGTVSENLGALIKAKPHTVTSIEFVIPTRFAKDSLYIRAKNLSGTDFSASSNSAGTISGTNISGNVTSGGLVTLNFAAQVQSDSITYDYDEVTEINVPSPPGGIDRSKLPEGGRVPVFHEFNIICVQDRNRAVHTSLSNGQTISVTTGANWVDIVDNDGLSLYSANDDNYSYDKDLGRVTIKAGISSFTGPFIITAVLSELVTVDNIEGSTLRILTPLKRTYPVGATVSSAYVLGDLQATTKDERTLSAWQNNFGATGSPASSAINTIQYPIELSNIGAIAQRWAIVFTSTTDYKLIGEHVGTIYHGSINADCVPINPFASAPYLLIRKEAFGAGLSLNPGECFLFETTTASKPIALTRSISPGHSEIKYDSSTLAFRGNKE